MARCSAVSSNRRIRQLRQHDLGRRRRGRVPQPHPPSCEGFPSRSPAEGSGSGFFRDFFATLKAGTASGNLERLFITGVSPVTMDDVTSGFNIGTNIGFDAAYKPDGGLHREGSGRFGEDIPRAKDQLRGYLADERLAVQHPSVRFTGVALVFRGWELVGAEAVA